MIITGGSDTGSQNMTVFIDSPNHRGEHQHELLIFVRGMTGFEQVVAVFIGHRPVVVLTAAVYTAKGLLMEQTTQAMLLGNLTEDFHQEHVVVGGYVAGFEHRSHFKLSRRHFVVTGLHRYAQLIEFGFGIHHEGQHTLFNGTPVMVFHLLPFGRLSTKERATGVDDVRASHIEGFVDQEILLLGSHRAGDTLRLVAQEA